MELNSNNFSDQKKEGHGGISLVYRSLWKPSKGKKVEAAMKILKPACTNKYLKVMNVLDEQSQPVGCRFASCKGFCQSSHKFMQPYSTSDFSGNALLQVGYHCCKVLTQFLLCVISKYTDMSHHSCLF